MFFYFFSLSAEAERIRKCKGRVLALKEEPHIQRVWLPYDDSPGLAMSRAFGDFVLKNNGIICTPEVSYYRLAPDDAFLVLASDGVSVVVVFCSSWSVCRVWFEFVTFFVTADWCRCGMC